MLQADQHLFATKYFNQERYQELLRLLDQTVGMHIEYRVAEMPVFVSAALRKRLESDAVGVGLACLDPDHLRHADTALEPRYTVPGRSEKPTFLIVDFAITQSETGQWIPKVVELQGFPSIYGYQFVYGRLTRDFYRFDRHYDYSFSNLSDQDYIQILHTAIVGTHDPDEVALLEYKPKTQKTRPDFLCTQQLIGVRETDICEVRKVGRQLFHERDGRWVPIKRIYNRAIVDELEENKVDLPFRWTDDLDVEWAGHPNWFFKVSKHSMPYLKHPSIPRTSFLSEAIGTLPDDLSPYVLKPLYAFAGKGVVIDPTPADIEAIPHDQYDKWILQEKINYADCVYTPLGMNKVELRVMMIWLDEWDAPRAVTSLARTGRGKMMGVRYNSVPWTGSTGCFFAEET